MDATALRRLTSLCAALVALVTLCFASPAAAQDDLSWPAEYREVGWTEASIIGGSVAGIAAVRYGWGEPDSPRWIGPILLDDAVRNVFFEDGKDVEFAAGTSDFLLLTLMSYTLMIDSVGVAGLANDEWNSAFQMSTIATQSHLLNILMTTSLKNLIARRRPGFGLCYADPFGEGCDARPNVSFPSGHTSSAFTGAGLVCVTHEMLPLYGGGAADKVACAAAIGLATTTGLLRISSNNHYLSDIFAGAILGFSIGYLLPRLVYWNDAPTEPRVQALQSAPAAPPTITWQTNF